MAAQKVKSPASGHAKAWWSASLYAGLLGLLVFFAITTPLGSFFTAPEKLQDVVGQFGGLAPTLAIIIHVMQVIVAPIPGAAIELANGYLFGWWGIPITLTGLLIGTVIAIVLARQFGRPLIEVLITPKGMKEIRPYMHMRSQFLFFFLFLLPGTPDDILCFAIGLSSIPLPRAVLIALLGRIPGVVGTVILGITGTNLNFWTFTLIAVATSLLLGLIILQTPLGKKIPAPIPGSIDAGKKVKGSVTKIRKQIRQLQKK